MTASLRISPEIGIGFGHTGKRYGLTFEAALQSLETRGRMNIASIGWPPDSLQLCCRSLKLTKRKQKQLFGFPCKKNHARCHCLLNPCSSQDADSVKNVFFIAARSFKRLQGSPLVIKLASAVGIIIFAVWGLGPLVRQSRKIFQHKNDASWKKSGVYQLTTSYVRPILLWSGAMLICRSLDPVVLPTEAAQLVKKRLLNFVTSLSTVLAFAYCLSSVIQQAQKFFMEGSNPSDARNMGFQFAGRAIYSGIWVAAVSLFMELLGFSTQKWLTAGGLGTVLLTLAGREIFTNFLSSVMIHATRPFIVNEWIQTKIEGYDVSGTVEHVGWWSPTIVRGEDREAVHIPNHKFTVNVVRNLSQKTHWRIKTHLAISHLDVSKINSIVADMRKVLAKNPQVEQQKLHRRVFLDNINPENQALMILVSCFVKTSHFEEYLCVKEAILLDLLRVIRHYRARLASPIRMIQKVYSEPDIDNSSDSMFGRTTVSNGPFLLIASGEDRAAKAPQARSSRANSDADAESSEPTKDDDPKSAANSSKRSQKAGQQDADSSSSSSSSGVRRSENTSKQDAAVIRQQNKSSPLGENIMLGVALEGSKRTLPIGDDDDAEAAADSTSNSEGVTIPSLRSGGGPDSSAAAEVV